MMKKLLAAAVLLAVSAAGTAADNEVFYWKGKSGNSYADTPRNMLMGRTNVLNVRTNTVIPPTKPAAAPQTLTSNDNAVSISVTGNFQDQLGGNALPEGAEAGTILQQYDENTDITLTVVDAGKPVKPAKEYYANLKTALEQAGFASLKAGAATENRMDYSFTDAEGNNHNCINIYSPDNLYAVCAFSSSADNATLAETLKDVKLLKKAM